MFEHFETILTVYAIAILTVGVLIGWLVFG